MGDKAAVPKPLGHAVGRHPGTGRPKLGERRAKREDFSIYDFDGPIPILAVEPPSPETEESYQLTISTEGGDALSYSLEELRKEFTVQEVPAHITCLMFNFTKPVTWTAIRLADILAKCEGEFNYASFYSWDTHETKEDDCFFETLPKNYALDPRTLLAIGMNGGPLRLAAPFLQGYKSVKWLTDIRLTTEGEVGYKKLHGFIEFPEFNPPPSA